MKTLSEELSVVTIEAINKIGGIAQVAAISEEQLVFLVKSIEEKTARDGTTIGNALRVILIRLQWEDTIKTLKDLGITTTNKDGSLLSSLDILKKLSTCYSSLSNKKKIQALEAVCGVYHINILKALLSILKD